MKTKTEIEFKKGEFLFHDRASGAYGEMQRLDSPREKYVCGHFLKWLSRLNNDALVLDVGGGTGHVAIQVAQRRLHIVVSDISRGMLSVSKEKFRRQCLVNCAEFVIADGESLPFNEGAFDCVMIVSTFHHLMNPSAFLHEAHRCLKPGGYLIIGVEPNYYHLRLKRRLVSLRRSKMGLRLFPSKSMSDSEPSPGDKACQGFRKRELSEMLSHSGFTILEFNNLVYMLDVSDIMASLGHSRGINFPLHYIEKAFMQADELIRRIPVVKEVSRELSVLCWRE